MYIRLVLNRKSLKELNNTCSSFVVYSIYCIHIIDDLRVKLIYDFQFYEFHREKFLKLYFQKNFPIFSTKFSLIINMLLGSNADISDVKSVDTNLVATFSIGQHLSVPEDYNVNIYIM